MRSKRKAPAGAATPCECKESGYFRCDDTTRVSARSSFVAGGKTPLLRRAVAGALLAVVWAAAVSFHPLTEALADSPAWEPETVYFGIVDGCEAECTPVPAPASEIDVPVDQEDAEILARLLWSSPLTNEDDKRLLCWIVFNRVDDERLGVFGATIGSVVIRREFTFYQKDAFLSDTNLRIAKEELRRWQLYLIGAVKERLLPAEYVYTSFSGHKVQFYSEIGGTPWTGS